jgi:hypothetical protein
MAKTPIPTPGDQLRALRESLRLAADLADALEAQADRVKRQCREIEEVLAGVDDLDGVSAPPPAPVAEVPKGAGPARLAAMTMALQGRTRKDVEAYLHSLEIEDADEILDGLKFQRSS